MPGLGLSTLASLTRRCRARAGSRRPARPSGGFGGQRAPPLGWLRSDSHRILLTPLGAGKFVIALQVVFALHS